MHKGWVIVDSREGAMKESGDIILSKASSIHLVMVKYSDHAAHYDRLKYLLSLVRLQLVQR